MITNPQTQATEIEYRLAALERDSHAPFDFTCLIERVEILEVETKNRGGKTMKLTTKWLAAVLVGLGLITFGFIQGARPQPVLPAPAPAAVPAPPSAAPPSSDWQAGFCAGWNAAQGVERQRHDNWRSLATAMRSEEGARTPAGQVADALVNSVAVYVLVQPATGQLTLQDGRTVNCAAPPAAPAAGGARQ